MKSHPVPKVGDTVVLNDYGLKQVCIGFSHMKTLRMKITRVDSESATDAPHLTYPVEVDNEEITAYMIDHRCFDVVESAPTVKYERWGVPGGREGVQRTLDASNAADMDFLEDGIRIVDEHGVSLKLTLDQAERMGIRIVAAKDIHTGEMKWKEESSSTPVIVVPASYGDTW